MKKYMRFPVTHDLKVLPEYFEALVRGQKKAEVRRNDRDFQIGDVLRLMEYDAEAQQLTGRYYECSISYICDYEMLPGFVCISLYCGTVAYGHKHARTWYEE